MRKNNMCLIQKIMLFITISIVSSKSHAQNYNVSDDGQYVFAQLYSPIAGQAKLFVVRSTSSSWYMELKAADNLNFGMDGKRLCYLQNGHLQILNLENKSHYSIDSVLNYALVGKAKSFLVYENRKRNGLNIRHLKEHRSYFIQDGTDYFVHPSENIFYIKITKRIGIEKYQQLLSKNMDNHQSHVIWNSSGEIVEKHIFSNDGKSLAFFTASQDKKSLWYYNLADEKVELLLCDSLLKQLNGKYCLATKTIKFTPNSKRLLFYLSSKYEFPETEYQDEIKDLLSYLDPKPNFYWKEDLKYEKNQLFSIDIKGKKILQIEKDYDVVVGSPYFLYPSDIPEMQIGNEYALVYKFNKNPMLYSHSEGTISGMATANLFNSNKFVMPDVYLINLEDGSRRLVKSSVIIKSSQYPLYYLSPLGNEVVYFDSSKLHFFVFDIKTGLNRNISNDITTGFISGESVNNSVSAQVNYFKLPGRKNKIWWIASEPRSIITQDSFGDIWKLSLDGAKSSCLTNAITKQTDMELEIQDYSESNVLNNEKLEFLATSSKFSNLKGYYQVNIIGQPKLHKLLAFDELESQEYEINMKRAKNSKIFLWELSNAILPPTIYYGKTFEKRLAVIKVKPKTDPVKQELIIWKDTTGEEHQGLIFFPKDFDFKKKYPVLINYYERMEGLLGSRYLDYSTFKSEIDLGYILFIPSLTFKVGFTSASVVNIVVTGAKELMKRPYINAQKMGIFGGSFSGYQTNCIIGHTDIFAAAFSVAGYSNLISQLGLEDRDSEQFVRSGSLDGQLNIGSMIWERPDLYLANSPIMFADRISCPLLLQHGRQDYRVPFEQGMEFYKGLQANGKKVWLDAPNVGHNGAGPGSVVVNKRARQFFGHYLKDEPAPYWMTRPALELLERGLDPFAYDPEIKTPGEGIIPKEKTYAPQVLELLKNRTTVDKNGRIIDVKN